MLIAGVDCSSKSIAFVMIENNEIRLKKLIESSSKDPHTRVSELFLSFREFMKELPIKPGIVFIEQALFLQNVKTTLMIDATINAVRFVCIENNIPCSIIDNRSWKKSVIGNGKASKEDIAQFVNLKWPDFGSTSQDLMDAASIAMFGVLRYSK